MQKYYTISESELRKLRWAIGLSIIFTFVNLTFYLSFISVSIGFVIVGVLLSRIQPSPIREDSIAGGAVPESKIAIDDFISQNGRIEKHPLYSKFMESDKSMVFQPELVRYEKFLDWLKENDPNQSSHTTPASAPH